MSAAKIRAHRVEKGRYLIYTPGQTWRVWRGLNGRWYGENPDFPGKMIDAPTLRAAKFDIGNQYFVNCASAGA